MSLTVDGVQSHFEAALLVLNSTLPRIVGDTSVSLVGNDTFRAVIVLLIHADKTVLSFAENLSVHFVSQTHERNLLAVLRRHVGGM